MYRLSSRCVRRFLLPVLWVGLPLLGTWLAGQDVRTQLAFPPMARVHEPEPFSWLVFIALGLLVVVILMPFVIVVVTSTSASGRSQTVPHRYVFPFWGWGGLVLLAAAWTIAWNRFSWLEGLQEYTFTPIWLGFILLINALTCARTGQCMLRDRTRYFLLLFPVSAVFWWGFEYLNRFVANWYYVDTGDFGPWGYFIYSTLPFSIVLPAVLGTKEWLESVPRISAGMDEFRHLGARGVRTVAWLSLGVGIGGLAGIAVHPQYLYPLVWVAPLLLITGLDGLGELRTPLVEALSTGDWRQVWLLALAGLVCGFFWEMWNFKSLARWEYAVPFAQRYQLFEMPLLGYAGYLPFGIACGAFAELFMPSRSNGKRRY